MRWDAGDGYVCASDISAPTPSREPSRDMRVCADDTEPCGNMLLEEVSVSVFAGK
jgi:hypothetical protein